MGDDDDDADAEIAADEDEDRALKCRRCVHDDVPVAREAAAAAKRHSISVWRVIGDGTTGSTNADRHRVRLGRRGF